MPSQHHFPYKHHSYLKAHQCSLRWTQTHQLLSQFIFLIVWFCQHKRMCIIRSFIITTTKCIQVSSHLMEHPVLTLSLWSLLSFPSRLQSLLKFTAHQGAEFKVLSLKSPSLIFSSFCVVPLIQVTYSFKKNIYTQTLLHIESFFPLMHSFFIFKDIAMQSC